MLAESRRLEKEINELTMQIDKLPKGKISISHTGKYTKWYHLLDKAKSIISKSNRILASELATKKYLEYLKDDLEHEKMAIDFYLRHHKMESKADVLFREKEYEELITPFFKPTSKELLHWMNSHYEKNMTYPEMLVNKTPSGNIVRSKSEAIIDTFLFKNRIPFRYECLLDLNGVHVFPDFTIRHPKTGRVYYWEHFGIMDDVRYSKNVSGKLQLYINNGIIPGIHLIITFETKLEPLNVECVEKVIEYYFL